MNITASDRTSLIRLAASLPVGDECRRAILAGLKSAFTYSGIPENEKEILMIVKDLFKMLDAKGYAKHIQLIDDGKVRVSGGDLRDFVRIVEEQAEFGPQKVKKGDPGLKYLNFEFGEVMSSVSSQAEKYGVYPVKFVTFNEVISPLLAALSKRYQDHSKGIVHEHYQKWDAATDKATDVEVEFVWKRSSDGDTADLKSFARAFQTAAKERFESLSDDRHLVYTKGGGYWVRL